MFLQVLEQTILVACSLIEKDLTKMSQTILKELFGDSKMKRKITKDYLIQEYTKRRLKKIKKVLNGRKKIRKLKLSKKKRR